ncbi:bile acid-sensitive ion channel-like [Mustelus asterias]
MHRPRLYKAVLSSNKNDHLVSHQKQIYEVIDKPDNDDDVHDKMKSSENMFHTINLMENIDTVTVSEMFVRFKLSALRKLTDNCNSGVIRRRRRWTIHPELLAEDWSNYFSLVFHTDVLGSHVTKNWDNCGTSSPDLFDPYFILHGGTLKKIWSFLFGKVLQSIENIRHFDHEFAASTSFHGLRNALQSKRRTRRVFWMLIVFGCVIVVFSQITQCFIRYFSWPTSTSVTIKYVEQIEFPAVTLCNLNRYQAQAVANLNIIYMLWSIVCAALRIGQSDGNSSTSQEILDFLQGNPSFSIKNFTKKYGYQLDNSTLLKCDFFGEPCSAKDFQHVFTEYGSCYTFNYDDNAKRRANISGRGLSVMLDIKQPEMIDNPSLGFLDAGISFVIHSPKEPPQVETMGLSTGVGMHAHAAIRQMKTINQEYPWGECNPNMQLEYHDTYTTYGCLQECKSKHIKEHCGCTPFLLPGRGPECEPEKYYNCAYPILHYLEKEGLCKAGAHNLNCPVPCEEIKYSTIVSYSTFPSHRGLQFLSENFRKSKQYIKENFVYIDIAYKDLNYEMTQQQKALPVTELIGDIGGQLGLFCGGSLITVIEILEYLLTKFYWICIVWLLKPPKVSNNDVQDPPAKGKRQLPPR